MKAKTLPNIHPGKVLLEEFLLPMEISQNALARATGVPPRRINAQTIKLQALVPLSGNSPPSLSSLPHVLCKNIGPGNNDRKYDNAHQAGDGRFPGPRVYLIGGP